MTAAAEKAPAVVYTEAEFVDLADAVHDLVNRLDDEIGRRWMSFELKLLIEKVEQRLRDLVVEPEHG